MVCIAMHRIATTSNDPASGLPKLDQNRWFSFRCHCRRSTTQPFFPAYDWPPPKPSFNKTSTPSLARLKAVGLQPPNSEPQRRLTPPPPTPPPNPEPPPS